MKVKKRQDQGDLTTVYLSGNINEDAHDVLLALEPSLKAPTLVFDCSDIALINSQGIMGWVNFFKDRLRDRKVTFRACPMTMIEVANLVPAFFCGRRVESATITYFCAECGREMDVAIDMAKDMVQERLPARPCDKCGEKIDVNDDLKNALAALKT